jgi:hypothetical protein
MITFREEWFNNRPKANIRGDNTFGNILFFIASTIGIATHNGYEYGFPEWNNREYFPNKLPKVKLSDYQPIDIPEGDFYTFDIPDNSSIWGYMQTEKYFAHCADLIRYYFTLKKICNPFTDCILIHYRNYHPDYLKMGFTNMPKEYYIEALKQMPDKRRIVVTDNIDEAYKTLGDGFEYTNNTPIEDFYLMCNAENLIISNSTFSWWGAWLSNARIVAPKSWFPGLRISTKDVIPDRWIKI